MLDIFYNVRGGFTNHPVLVTLSIVGIYILGHILFIGTVILLEVYKND